MGVSRRRWFVLAGLAAGGTALGIAAIVRPHDLANAPWEPALAERGALYRSVPGRDGLQVNLVGFEVQFGMHGTSTFPAVFVRNTGPVARLEKVEFVDAAGNVVERWSPLEHCAPDGWNHRSRVVREAPLAGRARTLVLCESDSAASSRAHAATTGRPLWKTDRPPTTVRLTVDGKRVELPDATVPVVNGQELGLVPYYFAA